MRPILSLIVIIAFGTTTALAAPCAIGTTVSSQGKQGVQDKSSNVDTSTKNLAGGEKAGAPKTVGALNNLGAETVPGKDEKKPEPGKVIQGQSSNDC
ncbi:hypothetical protein [Methylobacterium sp. CM6247]